MGTDRRPARGANGEAAAARHLTASGYRILERNFRTRSGELDLVAADAEAIVFCEVKTRVAGSSAGPAEPLDAIGPAKRRRLRRMAGQWLAAHPIAAGRPSAVNLRFDAIGITLAATGELTSLEHVRDAF